MVRGKKNQLDILCLSDCSLNEASSSGFQQKDTLVYPTDLIRQGCSNFAKMCLIQMELIIRKINEHSGKGKDWRFIEETLLLTSLGSQTELP